jgi:hypothetical protein
MPEQITDGTVLRWTDSDGSTALFTTDHETCGDADALAVMAIPHEVQGGVYLTPANARALIAFLQDALRYADDGEVRRA